MSIDTADTMMRMPHAQERPAADPQQRGAGRRWSAIIIGTGFAGIGCPTRSEPSAPELAPPTACPTAEPTGEHGLGWIAAYVSERKNV